MDEFIAFLAFIQPAILLILVVIILFSAAAAGLCHCCCHYTDNEMNTNFFGPRSNSESEPLIPRDHPHRTRLRFMALGICLVALVLPCKVVETLTSASVFSFLFSRLYLISRRTALSKANSGKHHGMNNDLFIGSLTSGFKTFRGLLQTSVSRSLTICRESQDRERKKAGPECIRDCRLNLMGSAQMFQAWRRLV